MTSVQTPAPILTTEFKGTTPVFGETTINLQMHGEMLEHCAVPPVFVLYLTKATPPVLSAVFRKHPDGYMLQLLVSYISKPKPCILPTYPEHSASVSIP